MYKQFTFFAGFTAIVVELIFMILFSSMCFALPIQNLMAPKVKGITTVTAQVKIELANQSEAIDPTIGMDLSVGKLNSTEIVNIIEEREFAWPETILLYVELAGLQVKKGNIKYARELFETGYEKVELVRNFYEKLNEFHKNTKNYIPGVKTPYMDPESIREKQAKLLITLGAGYIAIDEKKGNSIIEEAFKIIEKDNVYNTKSKFIFYSHFMKTVLDIKVLENKFKEVVPKAIGSWEEWDEDLSEKIYFYIDIIKMLNKYKFNPEWDISSMVNILCEKYQEDYPNTDSVITNYENMVKEHDLKIQEIEKKGTDIMGELNSENIRFDRESEELRREINEILDITYLILGEVSVYNPELSVSLGKTYKRGMAILYKESSRLQDLHLQGIFSSFIETDNFELIVDEMLKNVNKKIKVPEDKINFLVNVAIGISEKIDNKEKIIYFTDRVLDTILYTLHTVWERSTAPSKDLKQRKKNICEKIAKIGFEKPLFKSKASFINAIALSESLFKLTTELVKYRQFDKKFENGLTDLMIEIFTPDEVGNTFWNNVEKMNYITYITRNITSKEAAVYGLKLIEFAQHIANQQFSSTKEEREKRSYQFVSSSFKVYYEIDRLLLLLNSNKVKKIGYSSASSQKIAEDVYVLPDNAIPYVEVRRDRESDNMPDMGISVSKKPVGLFMKAKRWLDRSL